MTGNANSGRRPSPPVDVTTLKLLSLQQVLVLLRLLGRPMSRKTLREQIVRGRLAVLVDYLHHDRNGDPRYMVERKALDAWLRDSLVPLKVARLSA